MVGVVGVHHVRRPMTTDRGSIGATQNRPREVSEPGQSGMHRRAAMPTPRIRN
jgi:hypothetical protein